MRGSTLLAVVLFGTILSLSSSASATNANSASLAKPEMHHLLIEVSNLEKSLGFYRDCLGLTLKSQSADFATLESTNCGVYLWTKHWGWEKPQSKDERKGAGMYPHFDVPDIRIAIDRFKSAGWTIIQEPVTYDWGAEAFVQDPDGYIIALVAMTKQKSENALFQKCDAFFQSYVCLEGVDYARIIQDKALVAPVKELSSVERAAYDSFSEADKIAYLINLYNLFTIDLIVRHFPLKVGIKDIAKPWNTDFVPFCGATVSLDYIEHQLLRKKFNEPRIHFALVCASKGCPALSSRAYTGSRLDAQLTDAAKKFLSDTTKNNVKGTTTNLSEIFSWYGGDFAKKYGSYQDFVTKTLGLQGKFSVKFLDYDWRLNSAQCRK